MGWRLHLSRNPKRAPPGNKTAVYGKPEKGTGAWLVSSPVVVVTLKRAGVVPPN